MLHLSVFVCADARHALPNTPLLDTSFAQHMLRLAVPRGGVRNL